ncbi:SdrD B-like domain-containing protein [Pseudorhodobacter sp. MZDSW-24AT]|uniref:DUF7507 domain-containing protein n=1 Tax=Pseudorhodobacter sp. MZDSW-24AT TaxID=2052957 RepID=UPI000C1F5986|nr:SdrD B-like domain-containing protein [Pseudorhodobacter sp. MZDSW-24AT]PJF09386.1 hypothetical protein CUR21_13275 [Pseudorhodobacter sp. MZDSW-24AT]
MSFLNKILFGLVVVFALVATMGQARAQSVDWVLNLSDTGSDPTAAGGTIAYQITVTNDGFDTAPPTTIELNIPANTTFTGASGTITGCSPTPSLGPSTVLCEVPALVSDAQASLTAEVLTRTAGTVEFGASLPTEGDTNGANNSQTETTTVTAGADISLTLSAPPSGSAGSVIDYSFSITNNGPDAASNVALQFPIPAGIVGVLPPPGCVLSGSSYACTIAGPIPVGGSVDRVFQGQISAASGSTITAVGTVSGGTPPDPVSTNNEALQNTVVTEGSDLSITKSRSPSGVILLGSSVTFTLTPQYTGDSPTDIEVLDTIPASYTIDSVSAPGWTVEQSGQLLTFRRAAGSGPGANVALGPITITTTAVAAGQATNTASIASGGPVDPNPANNSANDGGVTIAAPTVDLEARKTGPVPALVVVGNTYDFQISAANLGNAGFFGTLVMTDTIPAGLSVTAVASNGWSCTPAASLAEPLVGPVDLVCTRDYTSLAPLAPGAAAPPVTIETLVTETGALLNTMTVSTLNANIEETNLSNNTVGYGVSGSVTADAADIGVIKTAALASLPAGEVQTFRLEITNAGPQTATSVTVSDALSGHINNLSGPTGAGFVSSSVVANSASGLSCSSSPAGGTGRSLTCEIEELPVCTTGVSCPVITVEVRPGGNAGSRTNTATAVSDTIADPNFDDNTGSDVFSVEARADVTVTKAASADPVAAGQNLTYVVSARNLANGLSSAANVTVTDTLPADLTFVSAVPSSGTCSAAPASGSVTGPGNDLVVCNLGSINNGAQQTVTITARPNLVTRGTSLTNSADVTTTTIETDTTNNSTSVTTAVAEPTIDLLVNKVDSIDPLPAGDATTYTITVTNLGPSAAENVVVTDRMPATTLTYQSHSIAADGVCSAVPAVGSFGETLTCSFPYMAPGATRTITVSALGVVKGTGINSVSVESDETALGFESITSNNEAEERTTVRTRADVEVYSKTSDPGTVGLREPFTYVIGVRNNTGPGRAEADNVVVSDTLPSGMVLTGPPTVAVIAGTASLTTCTGAAGGTSFSCSLGSLSGGVSGSGGTVEITVPVVVNAISGTPQTFTNTASVETSSFDEVPSNNSNAGPVVVTGSSIAGTVFRDFADDGALNDSDTGIGGVTLTLTSTDVNGAPITLTTTSASDGTYRFAFLPEGTYVITQGAISEAHLTDGQTAAGDAGGTVATPVQITGITLGADEQATGYLFPKIPQARVAIAKAVESGPALNPDGSFTVSFRLRVANLGLEALENIDVTDTLQGAAPSFGSYVVLSAPLTDPMASGSYTVLAGPTGSCGGLVSGYTGAGSDTLASGFGLAAGASCAIDLQLRVQSPNPLPPALTNGGTYLNQAVVTAEGVLSGQTSQTNPQLTDLSDNGTLADRNGNGIGNEAGENDPTPVAPFAATAEISLIKSLAGITDADDDGLIEVGDLVSYTFAVRNTGNVPLVDVTVTDPLLEVVGGPISLAVGASDTSTFTGTYVLTQDDIDLGYVENTAFVTANGVTSAGDPVLDDSGNPVVAEDVSDSGTNPDPAGTPVADPEATETPDGTGATDGDPTNDPTVAILAPSARIQLIKSVASVTDTSGDGLIGAGDTVAYVFSVTNTGNLRLNDVTIDDPLVSVAGGPIELAIGETNATAFTAAYVLTQADVDRGYVQNSAIVSGVAVTTAGTPVTDGSGEPITATAVSDAGTNPDAESTPVADPLATETPDGTGATDGDPTNDPTVALLRQEPGIRLIKRLAGTVDVNENGFVDVGDIANYSFDVTNIGNVGLEVTIADSIAAVIGGAVTLAAGETDTDSFTASYTITEADLTRGYVENTALARGAAVAEDGTPLVDGDGEPIVVTDVSDTGTNPDGSAIPDPEAVETPNGDGTTDGDPTNDPTVLPVGNPEISLSIEIADIEDTNGNGIIDAGDIIAYTFTVTNTGGVPLADVDMVRSSLSLPLDLVCTPISLAVGETQTLTCTGNTYSITAADVTNGTVSLSGTVNGTAISGVVVSDDDAVVSPTLLVGGLSITKTADRSLVNLGDVVRYTVTVTNDSTTLTTVTNIVDVLPRGFVYQLGTATLDGLAVEPTRSGRSLTWEAVSLPPGGSVAAVFDVLVGASVRPGTHDNVARAVSPLTGLAVSRDAIATVRVAAEPVFACATVIGRVFDDPNQDGYFNDEPPEDRSVITDQTYYADKLGVDPQASGEKGLPGVRLISPNGLAITTDQYGRFSVPCAALPADIGSNFMLKLDTRTLPSGYRLTTENPRVVRVTPGMITKLNFGATAARIVRIDLSRTAFAENGAPRAELVTALDRLVNDIASTPVMVRISYVLGPDETAGQGRERTRAVEKLLRRMWPSQGRYQLNLESVLQRQPVGEGKK